MVLLHCNKWATFNVVMTSHLTVLTWGTILLLQSVLQPLWVMACSTITQYSQQEGFYRLPLPVAHQTPNLEDQRFKMFQLPPPGVPHVQKNASEPQQRKVELWARNFPRILPKVATSTSLLVSFTCRKFTTWDRRLYFPSKGRSAEDFFARKPAKLGTRGQHAYL